MCNSKQGTAIYREKLREGKNEKEDEEGGEREEQREMPDAAGSSCDSLTASASCYVP